MKNFKQLEQLIDVSCKAVHAMHLAWIPSLNRREVKVEQWSDIGDKIAAIERAVWTRRSRLAPLRTAIERYQDFAKQETTPGRKAAVVFRDEATKTVFVVDSEETGMFDWSEVEA